MPDELLEKVPLATAYRETNWPGRGPRLLEEYFPSMATSLAPSRKSWSVIVDETATDETDGVGEAG